MTRTTCPDCRGGGSFFRGPYETRCAPCNGTGEREVTAKCDACGDTYPADAGTLFRFWSSKAADMLCPGCTAEALADMENWTRVDAPDPTPATIIAELTPADNAAGRYGAAAAASGPGGLDRAMLAACESLARQLGGSPCGQATAASIGRAGREVAA